MSIESKPKDDKKSGPKKPKSAPRAKAAPNTARSAKVIPTEPKAAESNNSNKKKASTKKKGNDQSRSPSAHPGPQTPKGKTSNGSGEGSGGDGRSASKTTKGQHQKSNGPVGASNEPIYSGSSFHNSPATSSLPRPSFKTSPDKAPHETLTPVSPAQHAYQYSPVPHGPYVPHIAMAYGPGSVPNGMPTGPFGMQPMSYPVNGASVPLQTNNPQMHMYPGQYPMMMPGAIPPLGYSYPHPGPGHMPGVMYPVPGPESGYPPVAGQQPQ